MHMWGPCGCAPFIKQKAVRPGRFDGMIGERICLPHARAGNAISEIGTHYAVFSSKGPWGRGELDRGNLVVYLHGFCASIKNLTAGVSGGMARHLVDQGFCVLAFDWLGHGYTDSPPGPIHAQDAVAQLEALLEHLKVTRPVHLFGYSTGALIASIFAARHPQMVRRLVFVAPFRYLLPGNERAAACIFYTVLIKLCTGSSGPAIDTMYQFISGFDGACSWGPALTGLREIRARVLVVCGREDNDSWTCIAPHALHVHACLPRSRLHWLREAGHRCWYSGSKDVQLECRRVVSEFLAKDEQLKFELPTYGGA